MPNPYFRFKQFTIWHDRCAMKVGTDGVLLGAWANVGGAKRLLDIGTGSGLIALMLAQRNPEAHITAIDIDENAVSQAEENINRSPFAKRIQCYKMSLQDHVNNRDKNYDHIISNPPFFINSLKSTDRHRTIARHADTLSTDHLLKCTSRMLSLNGKLSIIYPYENKMRLIERMSLYAFHPTRITNIYPTPKSRPKRILIELSKTAKSIIENELVIEEERHNYSQAFRELVSEFYLKV